MALLLATYSFPSVSVASTIAITGAAVFVIWLFLDCSFPNVAGLVSRDIRLHFVRDAHLRYWHRWEWYGPRLLAFAVLAALSASAMLWAISQLLLGPISQRSLADVLLVIAVLATWIALFALRRRLWWVAFRRRVIKLQPAMKAAINRLLDRWPEKDVFLPGLGNYGSLDNPDHLLHADPAPVPDLWETVASISRKPRCYVSFGISSYIRCAGETVRRCQVEYRMQGWFPPPTCVVEDRSPIPGTRTIRHEYDFPLGGPWHLAFYSTKVELKNEVDPDMLADIAKRPPTTRLPHRGCRFRSLADVEAGVWILHYQPGRATPSPMFFEQCTFPAGEVLRLDYEPDPSQSTHCNLMAEDRDTLQERLVGSKATKHRDYAGYWINLSYIDLDEQFEWLKQPAN